MELLVVYTLTPTAWVSGAISKQKDRRNPSFQMEGHR